MGREGVDISERSISHARRGLVVVYDFTHITATVAHDIEPVPRNGAEVAGLLLHPRTDGRIAPDRIGQPKDLVHSRGKLRAIWEARR
jgi:hypothetical protein